VHRRNARVRPRARRRSARVPARHANCTIGECPTEIEAKEVVVANRMRSLILAAAAVAVFTPLYITASAAEVTCRVPFDFVVNGTALPAGNYWIGSQGSGGALLVRGFRKSAVVTTFLGDRRADQVGRAKAVFLKTGDRYTLIEVWTTDGVAREIPHARRSAEEHARATNLPAEQIVIAGQ
jgi:hypothetical protein